MGCWRAPACWQGRRPVFYTAADGHRASGLRHDPFNALVAPRPIGWVSTVDADGRPNLAPFSYFNGVSADPPIVMFAPNAKDAEGTPKDTLRNVRETSEFVVNVVPWRLREAMNETSRMVAHGVDEFALAGVTATPSRLVRAPRVLESPAALECRVINIVPLPSHAGGRQSHVVLGEVIAYHIDDAVIREGTVDPLLIQPMARLGGFNYTCVRETDVIPRPVGDRP
jgi:flavin reductase (DIM6/NTAB) family NADH-FMN oxidoreductase RutF